MHLVVSVCHLCALSCLIRLTYGLGFLRIIHQKAYADNYVDVVEWLLIIYNFFDRINY